MNIPESVNLHQRSRQLELRYADNNSYRLTCELLRVYSPSAEVRGHGEGQEVLQTGKKNVAISSVKTVGNYALQLVFDDGHDTGLYSWDYLYDLCLNQQRYWDAYLEKLHAAGASRDPDLQVVRIDL
ncbi:MAG: DUF971 domain-containing protein [Halieaceae bacterium]|nr:DUF971 domain-containing protein [Halieaceae bacterium]